MSYNDGSMARANEPCPLTTTRYEGAMMAAEDTTTRLCRGCSTEKPITEFYRDRHTYARRCKLCANAYSRNHYKNNKNRYKEQARQWRVKNADRYHELNKLYYSKNKDFIVARSREYAKNHLAEQNAQKLQWRRDNLEKTRAVEQAYRDRNRDSCNARIKEWKDKNPHFRAEETIRRLAAKNGATPTWADREKILAIYAAASQRRQAGDECHVDHLVPLRSKLVCGLHCEANLAIVPAVENLRKNNRHWPDMP